MSYLKTMLTGQIISVSKCNTYTIIITDEVTFVSIGQVNKHNCWTLHMDDGITSMKTPEDEFVVWRYSANEYIS